MKCFICGAFVEDEESLLNHIREVHNDKLEPTDDNPNGYTAEQLWYHEKNKYKLKNIGVCACGRIKPWNQDKNKYDYYCGTQECKDKMRQVAVNNSMNKHGVENPSEVEENQIAMMEGKGKVLYVLSSDDYLIVDKNNSDDPDTIHKINGKYKNAAKYVYLSKVEEKTLIKLLGLGYKPEDIQAPMMNANIFYTMPNDTKKRRHIPDIYVKSLNLIISCKDSILNPNMHPEMRKDRFKNLYEYQAILNETQYNYFQIEGEEDIENLQKYLSSVKVTAKGGGRYVSPPKVDIYVLMQEGYDPQPLELDTFILNEQGYVFKNKDTGFTGFLYRSIDEENILENINITPFDSVVYDMSTITQLCFGESMNIYVTDTDKIKKICDYFESMNIDEMVNTLEGLELFVTELDDYLGVE